MYWLTSMGSEANTVSTTNPVIARESGHLVSLKVVNIDTIDKPRIRYQTTFLVNTKNHH